MIGVLSCLMALTSMLGVADDTGMYCVSPEYAEEAGMGHALGWYDGYEDAAYVVTGQTIEYTAEILWHELAHAWDLKKGTELNGYPSFFSETHTGFDLEAFARLQTLHLRVWPEGEAFPDAVPTDAEWTAMGRAGWLWTPTDG